MLFDFTFERVLLSRAATMVSEVKHDPAADRIES